MIVLSQPDRLVVLVVLLGTRFASNNLNRFIPVGLSDAIVFNLNPFSSNR